MAIEVPRGPTDAVIEQMMEALRAYESDHPTSRIALYRQNQCSVRVRIIDPDFTGQDRVERHADVWRYLDVLPDDTVADLSSLTLITPDEIPTSFANMEFEDPVPSGL